LKLRYLLITMTYTATIILIITGCSGDTESNTSNSPVTGASQPNTASHSTTTSSLSIPGPTTPDKSSPSPSTLPVTIEPTAASLSHSLLPGQTIFSEGITGLNPPTMKHPGYQWENCSSCHYVGASGALHLVEADHSCRECHWMNPRLPWFHPLPDNESCMICHLEVEMEQSR
jgi:hypothetical protein